MTRKLDRLKPIFPEIRGTAPFRWILLILMAAPLLFLTGCDVLPSREEQAVVRALTEGEQHVADADVQFGFNLFRAVNEAEPRENVFISPLSVSMALGMTLNGAEGETKRQMQEMLALAGLTDEEINSSYESLIDLLRGLDPRVVFEIANSIWYRQGFEVEADFLDVNRTHFDAEIAALDFNRPEAVDTINRWVDEKTRGKIEEIIDGIDADVVMYLINAIYFNGTWTYEFDPDDTRPEPFTSIEGEESEVPMMSMEARLPYYEDDNVQVVDLPYGDSLYSMTVVLPRENQDVETIAAGLDRSTWNDWTGGLQTRRLNLQLPRFELEYELQMKDVLRGMGMELAFDEGRADFTRINADGGLYIDEVKHKTFVRVDEEGTEAAAVTSVEVDVVSAGPFMRVDRPFVFMIRERHSGTILFMGKMVKM